MQTDSIYLSQLHNEEHSQYGDDFAALVNKAGAAKLKIEPQLEAFAAAHKQEKEAIEHISKSALTAKISAADADRDNTYLGMKYTLNAALLHFNTALKDAAERLKIVFDTYGNIIKRNYAEETGAINNLLEELRLRHGGDADLIGIHTWITELTRRNNIVQELLRSRDAEHARNSDMPVKAIRAQADDAYRAITERLDARAVIDTDADLEGFIGALNTLVARYNTILAQRAGRAAAKNGDTAETPPKE
jgi:hypothetical protein